MSPRQLRLAIEAKDEVSKNEYKEKIIIAYKTAEWAAQFFSNPKPEPLNKILDKIDKKENQKENINDLINELKKFNSQMGGKIE